jgi:hypothetical protein
MTTRRRTDAKTAPFAKKIRFIEGLLSSLVDLVSLLA